MPEPALSPGYVITMVTSSENALPLLYLGGEKKCQPRPFFIWRLVDEPADDGANAPLLDVIKFVRDNFVHLFHLLAGYPITTDGSALKEKNNTCENANLPLAQICSQFQCGLDGHLLAASLVGLFAALDRVVVFRVVPVVLLQMLYCAHPPRIQAPRGRRADAVHRREQRKGLEALGALY